MFINLYLKENLVRSFHLPDSYLKNIPMHSFEQNCKMREKIVGLHISEIKAKHAKLFEQHEISISLSFESKMNSEDFEILYPLSKAS